MKGRHVEDPWCLEFASPNLIEGPVNTYDQFRIARPSGLHPVGGNRLEEEEPSAKHSP